MRSPSPNLMQGDANAFALIALKNNGLSYVTDMHVGDILMPILAKAFNADVPAAAPNLRKKGAA